MFSLTTLLARARSAPAGFEDAEPRHNVDWSGSRPPLLQRSADDRLYFSVRPFAINGADHVLQYAFVDDRGNVVLSAFSRRARTSDAAPFLPPEDLPFAPFEPEVLEALLARVCKGANLVAFGRVLQSALLPACEDEAPASIDCAWRRFLHVGRQRRLGFDRRSPLSLGDAMVVAGLTPPSSEDAVMRALAIRDLWSWMDRVELSIV